jgi:hypothetical protein
MMQTVVNHLCYYKLVCNKFVNLQNP